MRQLLLSLLLVWVVSAAAAPTTLDITVPESVKVEGEDSYICITKPLPDKPLKLVGVEPMAKQEVVHHILLFGCDEPYMKPKDGKEATWECKHQPTCGGRQDAVLYGWGRNADKLELPKGVGFSVGKGSAVKWIVMQVHYLKEKPAGDNAGVRLSVQDSPVPYSAGMLSYASYFQIPPRKKSHMVLNHCCYRGFQPLQSFAVRVHTHTMGKKVFMNRAPATPNGQGDLVAVGDPQLPQGFYSTKSKTIWPGEHLTVGCDFDSSNKTQVVMAGSDHTHEMCNMYLMVYSSVSHIEMCSDGYSMVDDLAPGNMPHSAKLLRDPYPQWKPPKTADKLDKGVVGNIASVSLGPDGTVWVLSRGGRVWTQDSFDATGENIRDTEPIQSNVVMQLNPDTGKIIQQWGAGVFFMPHMLTVDRNNTVWVTDVGRHQALQFSASGKLLREVGEKMEPGHDHAHLCKPTQVAFLNDGSFLISDGYCNSRVLRFNPDGTFHSEYKLSNGRGKQQRDMVVPHSLVVDECDNTVMVADRENRAVHTFNLQTGDFIRTLDLSAWGKVWALTKGPYGRTLALVWAEGKQAHVIDVAQERLSWPIPDSVKLWPHDMALGAAAMPLTGAGDRMLALYVAPLCAECGPLEKYVLVPKDYDARAAEQAAKAQPQALPAGQRPPLAHAGSGYHAAHVHGSSQDGDSAAAQHQQHEQDSKDSSTEVSEENSEESTEKKVADAKSKVSGAETSGDSDSEAFTVFHTNSRKRDAAQGGVTGTWGVAMLMLFVGMVTGALVLFAYQKMSAQQRPLPLPHPVGNGVLYQQSCSTEDDAVVTDRDTASLLRR